MRQSNEVPIGKLGVRLNQAHVAALGLQDGAVARGQWVEGRAGRDKMKLPELPDDNEPQNDLYESHCQGPHLVVSSLHPDIWPAALRIDVRLSRQYWALLNFLSTIKSLGVSILSLHSKISGFQLLTLELYVEIPGLTAAVHQILAGIKPQVDKLRHMDLPKDEFERDRLLVRQHAFQQIGKRVLAVSTALDLALRKHDLQRQSDFQGFLHHPSRDIGMNSWFLSATPGRCAVPGVSACQAFADEAGLAPEDPSPTRNNPRTLVAEVRNLLARDAEQGVAPQGMACDDPLLDHLFDDAEAAAEILRRNFRGHSKPAIRVRGLPTLAYARVWRAFNDELQKPYPVIEFKLNGRLLEVQHKSATAKSIPELFAELTQSNGEETKRWKGRWPAFASFDGEERSMRLRLLRPAFARRYAWEVEFRYTIDARTPASGPCDSFAGVLHAICLEVVGLERYRIERIANSLLEVQVAPNGTVKHERGQICLAFVARKAPTGPNFELLIREQIRERIDIAINNIKSRMGHIDIRVDKDTLSIVPLQDSMERNA